MATPRCSLPASLRPGARLAVTGRHVPRDVGHAAWGQLCTADVVSQGPVRGWQPPLPSLLSPWHIPAERGCARAPQEHPCPLGCSRLVSLVTLG